MSKNKISVLIVLVLLTSNLILVSLPVNASPRTIIVPDDYPTIQQAISNAHEGDTVYVRNGSYSGAILIDKSLTLIGENKNATAITDWVINGTAAIVITHDNVTVTGFTIHNPSSTTLWSPKRGIHLLQVSNCNISGNNIVGSEWGAGIWLYESSRNIMEGNNVESGYTGIRLDSSSQNFAYNNNIKGNQEGIALRNSNDNIFTANSLTSNNNGVRLVGSNRNRFYADNITSCYIGVRFGDDGAYLTDAEKNTFYQNNFIDNSKNVESYVVITGTNYFDNGKVGNYYSNFHGVDQNNDGVSDTPYVLETYNKDTDFVDHFPLMLPFNTSSAAIVYPDWAFPTSVQLISPTNSTYASANVTLTFTVNKNPSWIGYSLDGQDNVTINGNTTIINLPNGPHNVTVSANDTLGKLGVSETIYFTMDVPEPFPTIPVLIVIAASVILAGAILLFYFKKRRRVADSAGQ
jgi:parallel beta-helix repeat protein